MKKLNLSLPVCTSINDVLNNSKLVELSASHFISLKNENFKGETIKFQFFSETKGQMLFSENTVKNANGNVLSVLNNGLKPFISLMKICGGNVSVKIQIDGEFYKNSIGFGVKARTKNDWKEKFNIVMMLAIMQAGEYLLVDDSEVTDFDALING